MNDYPQVLPATKMIGSKIVHLAGEELCALKDLVIDPEEGHIVYAVLSFGGLLGLGDKWCAMPWEALMLNPKDQTLILDVEKEVLKRAPGFDKDRWPTNAQYEAGWLLDLYQYYGYSPYWMPDK